MPEDFETAAPVFSEKWREQKAKAGMSYRDVAASAYRAFAASTQNKNFHGEPMPEFESLPRPIQIAWEAAIRQAQVCFDSPNISITFEPSWAGWLPPGESSPA